jgi:hypothetical protein
LSATGAASEVWELTALLDGGFRVTARFQITNEGPGERNALAFGHVLRPGVAPAPFQNARREGAWRLSPDGRRIEIGSSLLVLSDGARHFEVDNDKRRVKVFLDWKQDAETRAVPGLRAGYGIDVLQLATPVRGRIQVAEMSAPRAVEGTLTLTRTKMDLAESALVLRRLEVIGAERGRGLYFLDLLDPDGATVSWLWATGPGAQAPPPGDLVVASGGPATGLPGYAVPRRWTLRAPGIEGHLTLGGSILEVDPLAALPSFLRMVYSLRGRPHRSWTDARFDLSLASGAEQAASRWAGDAVAILTFLDRLPPAPQHP